ncbi:hypothetical protein CANMA_004414 [Candida margitis]|uniref:uncharacterized protein n=1 Tax=Candida margitis TaxID=1775924 RepID=UPI0022265FF5|nr:uncharacterized protein CANMA_004414 [Candida margitis]KAI5957410.1 hypothetical protein CANMA_004414 [Candida margitis]
MKLPSKPGSYRLANCDKSNNDYEADFPSLNEFQIFDDCFVDECINVETILKSIVEFPTDLVDLKDVFTVLEPSKTVKLHLFLDLSWCRSLSMDVPEFSGLANHLEDRDAGFSIHAHPFSSHCLGEINLKFFTSAEVLKLRSIKVKGSFSNCQRLRELSFEHDYDFEHGKHILDLPQSLKRFDYVSSCYSDRAPSLKKGFNFSSLTHVSINFGNFEEVELEVLQFMTSSNTPSVKYSRDFANRFTMLLNQVAREKKFKSALEIYSSESLTRFFRDNGEFDAVMGVSRLKCLKCLKLANLEVNDISNFTFPDSLEESDLSQNAIRSVEGVPFPKNLVSLDLSWNKLQEIRNVSFPPAPRKVKISGNYIEDVDFEKNTIDQKLKIETLFLGDVDLSRCKLPESLQNLS